MFTLKILKAVLILTINYWNIEGNSFPQKQLSLLEGVNFHLSQVLCEDAFYNVGEDAEDFATCHSYCAQGVFWLSYSDLDDAVGATKGFCERVNFSDIKVQ